jgi:hypothetical protein
MKKQTTVLHFLIGLMMAFAGMVWGESVQKQYVVKSGDTLGDIIWTLRAQGIDVTKLGEWNPGLGTQVTLNQKIIYYVPEAHVPAAQVSKTEMEQAVQQAVDKIAQRYEKAEKEKSNATLRERESGNAKWLFIFCIAVLVIAAIVLGVILRKRADKTNEPAPVTSCVSCERIETQPSTEVEPTPTHTNALIDPTYAQLKIIAEFPIDIRVSLPEQGMLVPAIAELHENKTSILVKFGDSTPVAFDKRRQSAKKWLDEQPVETWDSLGIVPWNGPRSIA